MQNQMWVQIHTEAQTAYKLCILMHTFELLLKINVVDNSFVFITYKLCTCILKIHNKYFSVVLLACVVTQHKSQEKKDNFPRNGKTMCFYLNIHADCLQFIRLTQFVRLIKPTTIISTFLCVQSYQVLKVQVNKPMYK